jgi:hypothetical protein
VVELKRVKILALGRWVSTPIDDRNRKANDSLSDGESKEKRRARKQTLRTAEAILSGVENEPDGIKRILEINWALIGNSPTSDVWRESLDALPAISRMRDLTLNAVDRGDARKPASNLASYGMPDLSRVDPTPSKIALLRAVGPNKKLNYDPVNDGPLEATLGSNRTVAAKASGSLVIVNGKLKTTRAPEQSSARKSPIR